MSASGGPDLITNNLVFHVDASNPRCYSGGSVCRDLTNINGNGTITNVSLSADKAFIMNSNTSKISFTRSFVNATSNFTYSCLISSSSNSFGLILNSMYNAGGIDDGIILYKDNSFLIGTSYSVLLDILAAGGGDQIQTAFPGVLINQKALITASYKNNIMKIYLNGILINSQFTVYNIDNQNLINLGASSYPDSFYYLTEAGLKIYQASIYNRGLDDGEVLSYYNVLKTRYKI